MNFNISKNPKIEPRYFLLARQLLDRSLNIYEFIEILEFLFLHKIYICSFFMIWSKK